jgi:hypothetical protein
MHNITKNTVDEYLNTCRLRNLALTNDKKGSHIKNIVNKVNLLLE